MAAHENQDAGHTPAPGLFTTTHWSVVRRAQDNSETALNSLFHSYRRPLLIWLQKRARDYTPLEPEDLLQGFCLHLLKREFLANVEPEKGRFRNFLQTAIKRYANDQHAKWRAAKRGSGQAPDSLQETDGLGQPLHDPAATDATPDLEFDRAWAQTVLANSLRRLQAEYARTHRAALCSALEPVMYADETAPSYREIGERLGMGEGAVKQAALRLRARFREILREEVAQTVDEPDLEDELRYLLSLFRK